MTQLSQAQMLKAIDLLVQQGRAEHTTIDGKPAIRLIKPSSAKSSDVGEQGDGK